MQYTISNLDQLIDFIEMKEVSISQGLEVSSKFLNVIPFLIFDGYTKEKMINDVKKHIELFEGLPSNFEKPIFLNSTLDVPFNIRSLYND